MNRHHHTKHRHRHHHHHHKHAHRKSPQRDWQDFIARYYVPLVIAALIPVLGLCGYGGWALFESYRYQNHYGPALETELGFHLEAPLVQAGDKNARVNVIVPIPGGYMEKIGFLPGDIITSHSATEFYKMLHQERGRVMTVNVVDGGDGAPIETREVRTRKFAIPVAGS